MRSRWWLGFAVAATVLASTVLLSCQDPTSPDNLPAVEGLEVVPLSKSSIRLSWLFLDHPDVTGYQLERRVNFEGEFEVLPVESPQRQGGASGDPEVFIDEGLKPETFYGYRVRALSRFGSVGASSVVRGAPTAPEPGLQVTITSQVANSRALDTDGYTVRASGPNGSAVNGTIEPDGTRRFNPLVEGEYTVWLTGLAPQCTVDGENERTAIVADSGINTIDSLAYAVECRDPELGRIVVGVDVRGDSIAPRYRISLTSEDVLPDTVLSREAAVPTTPGRHVGYGVTPFDDLAPATYTVRLSEDLAPECDQIVNDEVVNLAEGAQQVTVSALSLDTVLFEVTCNRPFNDTSDRPIVIRNIFPEQTAPPGSEVTLGLTLDLSKVPDRTVGSLTWETHFDATILEFVRYEPESPLFGGFGNLIPNSDLQPGLIVWSAFDVFGKAGGESYRIADVTFNVIGEVGDSMRIRTELVEIGDEQGNPTIPHTIVGAEEGWFKVVTATGSNQAPTAVASAEPTTVGVNEDVSFSGDQSSDPDGTIVTYEWDFGDGGTSTQANPTHQYTDPGTYAATLTVTDDDDATDEDDVQITVAVAGPTAAIASVSPKIVGMSVAFDGSGSSGTGALTYDWNFAGVEVLDAGATPSHIFKTLGQKTVVLTVTDGNDLTDEAQITVQVDGPVAEAGENRNVFKDSVVTYDGTSSRGAGLTYAWDFAGAAASGAMPMHTFTSTGAKTVTLTVTDSLGFEDDDVVTVTVVDASKFQWTSTFGPVTGGRVPLVITYDMRSDPNAALNGFVVDSIMWDPAVLTFAEVAYDCTCGGQNTSPSTDPGVVRSIRAVPLTGDRTGLVDLATIWFDVVGDRGSSTGITTVFDESMNRIFGEVSGTPEQFLPRTEIIDAMFTVPVAQVGTVQGQITSSATMSGISGVEITVTPMGGTALAPVTTDASGNYMVADVPVANGTGEISITLATLPADCQAVPGNAGPFPYSGLTSGGTTILNRQMDCPPPPVEGYEFGASWENANPSVGSQAILLTVIDMSTFDDPNNAHDDATLGALDFNFTYNETVILAPTANACIATDPFSGFSVIPNSLEAGIIQISMFTTSGNATNPKPLTTCLFNVVGAGTSSQAFGFTSLANAAADPLDPSKIVVVTNEDLTAN